MLTDIPDIDRARYAFWGDTAAELATLVAAKTAGITGADFITAATNVKSGAYGSPAAARLLHKLKRNVENCSVVVLGDSTGRDVSGGGAFNRWVYQWAALLAPTFPAITFKYHQWDDTAALYDTESGRAVQTIQTGTGTGNSGGPFVCDIYNGSISGTIMPSPLGVNAGLTTTLNGAIASTGATSCTVTANPWNAGAVQYTLQVDFEQMLVTAGQGTTGLTITRGVNGTTAATHSSGAVVSLHPRWINMLREVQPDLVIGSYGHNEASVADVPNRCFMLYEHVALDCPDAHIMLIAQNPSLADGNQALRASAVENYCALRGWGFIDVHQAFVDAGTPASYYVAADNVHPSVTGSAAWATEVQKHFVYSADLQPRTREPSLFSQPAESLMQGADMQEWNSGLKSWTRTGSPSWAQDSSFSPNPVSTSSIPIKFTTVANTKTTISQGLGNVPATKGQWFTALALVFVPVGSSTTNSILGVNDGVTETTTQTPSTEGQGMWRYLVVRKRMDKAGSLITVNFYPEYVNTNPIQIAYCAFCTLVPGGYPRPVPMRARSWFVTDVEMANGKKWKGIEAGSSSTQGVATLVAGTVTVSATKILTGDRVRLTPLDDGGSVANWGSVALSTVVNATSFIIKSSNTSDVRQVFWEIVGIY